MSLAFFYIVLKRFYIIVYNNKGLYYLINMVYNIYRTTVRKGDKWK